MLYTLLTTLQDGGLYLGLVVFPCATVHGAAITRASCDICQLSVSSEVWLFVGFPNLLRVFFRVVEWLHNVS
jgi:hypothetical protein